VGLKPDVVTGEHWVQGYIGAAERLLYTRFCCVAIPVGDGDPVLVIPSLDLNLALGDWWSPTWFTPDRVKAYGPTQPVSDYMVFVREFVQPDARMGVDTMSFTAYMSLEDAIPGLKAVGIYEELNSLKQIKSEAEIAALARANQIASRDART
jgi:Xaa-Pro aminopeptidase